MDVIKVYVAFMSHNHILKVLHVALLIWKPLGFHRYPYNQKR
jgi:hypothetical protein